MEEFAGRAVRLTPEEYLDKLDNNGVKLPTLKEGEEPTHEQWTLALSKAIADMSSGKMMGSDQVPSEFMKAAGPTYVDALALVAKATTTMPIPVRWMLGTQWYQYRGKQASQCLQEYGGCLREASLGKPSPQS